MIRTTGEIDELVAAPTDPGIRSAFSEGALSSREVSKGIFVYIGAPSRDGAPSAAVPKAPKAPLFLCGVNGHLRVARRVF